MNNKINCIHCQGSAIVCLNDMKIKCTTCNGSGELNKLKVVNILSTNNISIKENTNNYTSCIHCLGMGHINHKKCPTCYGKLIISKNLIANILGRA